MVRVERNTVIALPCGDVFSRLIDLAAFSRWMPKLGLFIKSGPTSEGPVVMGATYFDTTWMGTFRGEVVEFAAVRRVVFRETLRWLGVAVLEARLEYELAPTLTGTALHHTAEGRLFGAFKLMEPIVSWMARGERDRTVRALKDSLEGGR